ncbi:MAG: protein kinase, partial [Planctomycetota bacterium]
MNKPRDDDEFRPQADEDELNFDLQEEMLDTDAAATPSNTPTDDFVDAEDLLRTEMRDLGLDSDAAQEDSTLVPDEVQTLRPEEMEKLKMTSDGESTLIKDQPGAAGDHIRTTTSEFEDTETPTVCSHQIEGFEVLDELGKGAFGVVYRARDTVLDRQVAIKIPLLSDKKLGAKYIQEARNAAQIDATGIVPVLQVGSTAEDQPFVVQKLIEGSTLFSLMRKPDALPLSWSIQTMSKIARAIAHAHQAGLVHRDLKPSNILIDPAGEPWVADFGLAVFEEDQRELKGEVAGTPAYMSPEQLSGRADWLDGRADIWALGVILYEVLCGRPPFQAKDFKALREQICGREPRPLIQLDPSLPPELDAIFARCCAKKVKDRYPSATEFANDLDDVLATTSMPNESIVIESHPDGQKTIRSRENANTISGTTRYTQRTIRSDATLAPKSNRLIAVALAGLFVLGATGFVLIWNRISSGLNSLSSQSAADSTTPVGPTTPGNSTEEPKTPSLDPNSPIADPPIATPTKMLVDTSGQGTHTDLGEAVAQAEPGSTIFVAPGSYRIQIEIADKEVEIVGEGIREDITLIGEGGPAFSVASGAALKLKNVSIRADGEDINTIETEGALEIDGCIVETRAYDCIKARPGARIAVANSRFLSAKHPAISAAKVLNLRIEKCDFRFRSPNVEILREDPVVAVELTECGANLVGCTFTGIGGIGKGVSARDCKENIEIRNCQLANLMHGIEVFDCASLVVSELTQIDSCEIGIYSEGSTAEFQDLEIRESNQRGLVGLRRSRFRVIGGKLVDNEYGCELTDSTAQIDQCQIQDSKSYGLQVNLPIRDGTVEKVTLNECRVTGSQSVG